MTGDDDGSQDADDEQRYRVGSKALDGAALGFAQRVSVQLAEIVGRLMSGPPLGVREVASGIVRTELFAEDAMRAAALLAPVAGTLVEGVQLPEAETVAVPAGEIDCSLMHPTWYAMRDGVDYQPGLAAAFAARAALRDVLRAVLPRGPLAMVPTANVLGRGVVRLDLTPADAERVAVLLCYAGGLLEYGRHDFRL